MQNAQSIAKLRKSVTKTHKQRFPSGKIIEDLMVAVSKSVIISMDIILLGDFSISGKDDKIVTFFLPPLCSKVDYVEIMKSMKEDAATIGFSINSKEL